MACSGHDDLQLTLLDFVHGKHKKEVEKPAKQLVEYKIPTGIVDRARKLKFAGDRSQTAMGHLYDIEDLCSLFKLTGIHENEVRRKLLYMSLTGNAHEWYRSLDKKYKLDWDILKKAFYLKFYTPKEAYEDRCNIYNFWPHKGESIAQAWERLKGLIHKNPCHGIPESIILINFYVRLPEHHITFLDNSSRGSFTNKTAKEAAELLDIISQNTEAWDLDKGNIPGLDYEYSAVESFVASILFADLRKRFGVDIHVLIEVAKSFASHMNIPKGGFTAIPNPPIKPACVPKVVKLVHQVSSPRIEEIFEVPPYPSRVKQNLLTTISNKSARRCHEPYEQIQVQHQISAIKELNEEMPCDVYLCEDSTKVIKGNTTRVGKPIISCTIGTSCYHGLCDIGASISVIPYSLYLEIKPDIDPIDMEETGITIQLANKEYICPLGLVRDVEVLVGKIKYPADFIVLGCSQDAFCPIIFGRPFLHTVGAEINLKKEKVFIKFAGERLEFNFSKFTDKHLEREKLEPDVVETLASVAVASSDAMERYVLNQEEPFHNDEEREMLEQILSQQPPQLQLHIPPDNLGVLPPQKEDPSFELKPLPEGLKYAFLDDKNIYPVIISANLSGEEESKLLEVLRAHRPAIGYSLDDLKGISPALCMHKINLEEDAKPVVDYQRRLHPKMK